VQGRADDEPRDGTAADAGQTSRVVVVVDHSSDHALFREMAGSVELHGDIARGVEVDDVWAQAPFVAARRLTNALVRTPALAGDVAVVVAGERARLVDPDSVATVTMDALYGTNFHQALSLARACRPQQIVIVAYSAPSAHFDAARNASVFSFPPRQETLTLTKFELDLTVASGARIDLVLISDPARPASDATVGRLHEIHDMGADAAHRSQGTVVQLDTPLSQRTIDDVVGAIAGRADG
jgi:hypothetical protein